VGGHMYKRTGGQWSLQTSKSVVPFGCNDLCCSGSASPPSPTWAPPQPEQGTDSSGQSFFRFFFPGVEPVTTASWVDTKPTGRACQAMTCGNYRGIKYPTWAAARPIKVIAAKNTSSLAHAGAQKTITSVQPSEAAIG
jgi:hypothetical protein